MRSRSARKPSSSKTKIKVNFDISLKSLVNLPPLFFGKQIYIKYKRGDRPKNSGQSATISVTDKNQKLDYGFVIDSTMIQYTKINKYEEKALKLTIYEKEPVNEAGSTGSDAAIVTAEIDLGEHCGKKSGVGGGGVIEKQFNLKFSKSFLKKNANADTNSVFGVRLVIKATWQRIGNKKIVKSSRDDNDELVTDDEVSESESEVEASDVDTSEVEISDIEEDNSEEDTGSGSGIFKKLTKKKEGKDSKESKEVKEKPKKGSGILKRGDSHTEDRDSLVEELEKLKRERQEFPNLEEVKKMQKNMEEIVQFMEQMKKEKVRKELEDSERIKKLERENFDLRSQLEELRSKQQNVHHTPAAKNPTTRATSISSFSK
eukprot:TRINITY_DN18710_c0_g1_i1.p1 TRINITY_DN18710_c0_g1~~TRINITY_DN18710_c0_g1_i1.p1  ORF type:complete len:374 (-),score=85.70 TRINITY_DN18710_c0_g1_i1:89-1210(-)